MDSWRRNQEIYVLRKEQNLDLHLVLQVRGQLICGVDRPAANADERKAGIPVSSRYGTGHTHDIAPSAICPAN